MRQQLAEAPGALRDLVDAVLAASDDALSVLVSGVGEAALFAVRVQIVNTADLRV